MTGLEVLIPEKIADVVILDEEYSVIDTFVKGRKIEQ